MQINFSSSAPTGRHLFTHIMAIPHLGRRLFALVMGNVIMGLGVSFLRLSLFGNDPFSCMNLGYSSLTALSLGSIMIIINALLLIPVLLLERAYIQFGTLVYLIILGPVSDLWYGSLAQLLGTTTPLLATRLPLLVSGIIISCFGTSLYICADMGMGPYDALGWIIEHRSHNRLKFRYARIILDFMCTAVGFLLGSIVSAGTLTMAFFTGPLISFFNEKVNHPFIYRT